VALYSRLGFARWSTDVCFRRQVWGRGRKVWGQVAL